MGIHQTCLRRDCDFNYNGMKRRMEELLNGGVPLKCSEKTPGFVSDLWTGTVEV